jgi:hypothetical protein
MFMQKKKKGRKKYIILVQTRRTKGQEKKGNIKIEKHG